MKSKPIAIVVVWMLCIGLFLLILMQMQSYAGIINNTGVIRGGTQRIVKMELAERPSDDTKLRVESLLNSIQNDEENKLIKTTETNELLGDISKVQAQWDLIKEEIDAIARGEGSESRLIDLSEQHFELADEMVSSAQRRAEHEFVWTMCVSFALAAIVSLFTSLQARGHRRKINAALRTDPLTKNRNLFAFEEDGIKLVNNPSNGPLAVVYSNISGFRSLNELFGRDAGDKIILSLQQAFSDACKLNEISAHANADHFVALLRIGSSAERRVNAFRDEVARHLSAHSDFPLTDEFLCGYGVFTLSDLKVDVATAISNATAVLKQGSLINGVAWYDDAFRMQLEHENNIFKYCDQGIRDHEFVAYLQPQISLSDGRLTGAEMLCRWDSPNLGFLMPDQFIPCFERSGLIVKLDFYMMEQACRCYPFSQKDRVDDIRISVNLTRVTILQPEFEDRILDLINSLNVPASFLEIEVTEGLFSVDEDAIIAVIERLRDKGFRFAMDDFGTGYSSLSLLRKLPIDVLKIDRGFLSQSTHADRSLRVLRGTIELADSLKIETVCEGIETKEQAYLLSELGCSIGQGFLFDRPIPLQEFASRYEVNLGTAAFDPNESLSC